MQKSREAGASYKTFSEMALHAAVMKKTTVGDNSFYSTRTLSHMHNSSIFFPIEIIHITFAVT